MRESLALAIHHVGDRVLLMSTFPHVRWGGFFVPEQCLNCLEPLSRAIRKNGGILTIESHDHFMSCGLRQPGGQVERAQGLHFCMDTDCNVSNCRITPTQLLEWLLVALNFEVSQNQNPSLKDNGIPNNEIFEIKK
jgi:hypothetical protein